MSQIPRQWRILRKLEAHRYGLPVSELAADEDCGIRTIYRDLRDLQEAGFPIVQERRGRQSLWRLAYNRSQLKGIPFTFSEVCALWLGRGLMKLWEGTELYEAITSAFEKIRATLSPGILEHFQEFSERVLVRGSQFTRPENPKIIETINEALASNQRLIIKYYSPSRDEVTTRKIDPYRLWLQDSVVYLIAYCHLRKDFRTFHISRIREVTPTDEYFEEDESFSIEKFLAANFRTMGGEVHQIEIRFDRKVAHFIKEKQHHPTQEYFELPNGDLILKFRSGGLEEISKWVLSFGDKAVVLKPDKLRDMVLKQLKKALENYEKEEKKTEKKTKK